MRFVRIHYGARAMHRCMRMRGLISTLMARAMIMQSEGDYGRGYQTVVMTDDIVHITPVIHRAVQSTTTSAESEYITCVTEEATGWTSWVPNSAHGAADAAGTAGSRAMPNDGVSNVSTNHDLDGVEQLDHSNANVDIYGDYYDSTETDSLGVRGTTRSHQCFAIKQYVIRRHHRK